MLLYTSKRKCLPDWENSCDLSYINIFISLLLCVTFWSLLPLHILWDKNYTIVFYPWLALLYYSSLMKQCYHNLLCKAHHQLSVIHSTGVRGRKNRKLAQPKELIKWNIFNWTKVTIFTMYISEKWRYKIEWIINIKIILKRSRWLLNNVGNC